MAIKFKTSTVIKGRIFGSEQIAMNITIYHNNYDVEILPAYCNWTLIDRIKYDSQNKKFVEPYLPNHEIGIIHFAGKNNDQIRTNKNFKSNIKTLDDKEVEKSLRFLIEKKNKISKNWINKQKKIFTLENPK